MSEEPKATATEHLRALGPNAGHTRRNHVLGVLAGCFAGLARNMLQPEIIVIGLVSILTDNPWLIAMVPVLNKVGALGPQLLASNFVEHLPRRRPAFIALAIIRTAAYVALFGAMWLMVRHTGPSTLALFFGVYFVTCMLTGASIMVFSDMMGRLIPAHRLGAFLGTRLFLGGGLGVLCGLLVVQPILGRIPFPTNYLLLAGLGAVLVAVDMSTWSMCREEPGPRARTRTTLRESLRRGFQWLRTDANYRSYFVIRVAFRINYLGFAFFIPFGKQELARYSGPGGIELLGGIMLASLQLAGILGSVLWGKLADWKGSRATLVAAGLCFIAAPSLALLAPHLPTGFEVPIPGTGGFVLNLPLAVYLFALATMGLAIRANMIGGRRFLVTNAPPHRRPSYMAFLNALTTPLAVLPLAAAWLIESAGMTTLFTAVVGGGLLALVPALRMRPREVPLTSEISPPDGEDPAQT